MPRPSTAYISEDEIPGLIKTFVRNYESEYWMNRVDLLYGLYENIDSIFEGASDDQMDEYRQTVEREFLFQFYHSTEALLGLIWTFSRENSLALD